ncbi:MAG: sulfotransferase family protein [Nitrososphaeraceae archaeon]
MDFYKYYCNKYIENILLIKAKYFLNIPLITPEQVDSIHPFFIIGSGRSGTTLLRTILYRTKKVVIPPESNQWFKNAALNFVINNHNSWENLCIQTINMYSEKEDFKYWNTDLITNIKTIQTADQSRRSFALIIDYIYKEYLKQHKNEASFWGDKTPYMSFALDWVNIVFPNAKYIHMLRDGRDVVLSMVSSLNQFNNFNSACDRWNWTLNAIQKFEKKNHNKVLTVKYEDLVSNPENHIKKVFDFLNIEYSNKILLQENNVEIGDDVLSHHQNTKKPITTDSIGRWKSMPDLDLELVNSKLKKNLIKYGYTGY